jgi:hypothetical protein
MERMKGGKKKSKKWCMETKQQQQTTTNNNNNQKKKNQKKKKCGKCSSISDMSTLRPNQHVVHFLFLQLLLLVSKWLTIRYKCHHHHSYPM